MKLRLRSKFLLLFAVCLIIPGMLLAASAVNLIDDAAIQELLNTAGQDLATAQSEEQVEALRKQLPDIKAQISSCIENSNNQLERLNKDLKDLENIGESAIGKSIEILKEREDLEEELGRVGENNFNCNKLEDNFDNLNSEISHKLRDLTAQRLTQHNFSLRESITALPTSIPNILDKSRSAFDIGIPEQRNSFSSWLLGLFLGGLGIGMGFMLQVYTRKNLAARKGPGGKEPFEFNLLNSFSYEMPWIIGGTIGFFAFNAINSASDEWNLPTRLFLIMAVFGFANFLFRWICKEHSPGDTLHGLNKQIPKVLVKHLRFTAIVAAVGFGIFTTQWLMKIPEVDLRLPYQITNIILALSFLSTLQLAGKFTDLKGRYRLLRLILILASVLAIIATLAGYINAANYLLFAVLTTLVAALLLWILIWTLDQSVDGIINGKTKTSYKLRATMGIRAEETSSELGWLRLLSGLGLWASFGLFLLYVWDFTDSSIPAVKFFATDGFNIGEDTRIIPQNILIGLLVFALVLSFSIWLKARLERKWLRNIGMERGSRDAVVTLTGYIGMIIALLMGLTAAGVSFTGLALVAGALSVGIGFGLQNIVNNFISGLILLFERPIHSGDFITVGNVEGTVKRISIRSTEIETLQRTSVIVPNSELISGQVTNWVLHDAYGVIHVPVGVAYGSDTKLVNILLLEVALEHPEIISRPNLQQPIVRFKGFGDNSLDFVLVALIKTITKRFDIISELNFAIDQKLRENHIEIPFPQRDIHLKMPKESHDIVMPDFLKPNKGEIVEKPDNDN